MEDFALVGWEMEYHIRRAFTTSLTGEGLA